MVLLYYEIDVLNLGNADAKIIDLYDDSGVNLIILIDGGNPGDGFKIINNLKRYHQKKTIDLVICTHPDRDHIGGLSEIVRTVPVSAVWIHDPLRHVDPLFFRLLIGGAKSQGKAKHFVESFEQVFEFISLIDLLRIPRSEPFSGLTYGPLLVVGPSLKFYEEMLLGFKNMESLIKNDLKNNNPLLDLLDSLTEQNSTGSVLDGNNETSNENNSSVIVLGLFDNKKFLFTGDAGVQALLDASFRYKLNDIHWFDVPHHGSKHNLNTLLLNHFRPQVSYISADGSKKHPSLAVINALKKQGLVYSTHNSGNLLWSNWNNPLRIDYFRSAPL